MKIDQCDVCKKITRCPAFLNMPVATFEEVCEECYLKVLHLLETLGWKRNQNESR